MLKHQFVTSGAVAVALAITVGSPAVATSHQEQSPEAYRGAGNGASDLPDVSVNGRYVVFQSSSTNLVPGDTNARIDVFLRDTALNKTRLISKARAGGPANGDSTDAVVSDDGKIIVFTSTASNIVAGDTNGKPDVFRTDLSTGIATARPSPLSAAPQTSFPETPTTSRTSSSAHMPRRPSSEFRPRQTEHN